MKSILYCLQIKLLKKYRKEMKFGISQFTAT
jgi:hypothetical protein